MRRRELAGIGIVLVALWLLTCLAGPTAGAGTAGPIEKSAPAARPREEAGNQAAGADNAMPVAVAFDFESDFDGGKWGKKVGEIFRGHLQRQGIYQTLDEVSFNEALDAAGFRPKYDTPPEKVAQLMREPLQADLAIWGKVTKPEPASAGQSASWRTGKPTPAAGKPEVYKLWVRVLSRDAQGAGAAKVLLDEQFTCDGRHAIPPTVDTILDRLQGKPEEPGRDLLADESWKKRPNLVKNPGFEDGADTPSFWEPVNGLTSFWVDGASPTGKCVMLDTDVYDSQYTEWAQKFQAGAPASQAPKKIQPTGDKYDTVGGAIGSHLYSDWIPIEQGPTYRFDLDVKGPRGNAMVFIKGYAAFKATDFPEQRREVYRAQVHLHMKGRPGEWEHFAQLFHPTQPLILLGFDSDFDGGQLGSRLAALVRKQITEAHDLKLASPEIAEQAVKEQRVKLTAAVNRLQIAQLVRENFGRGTALWGQLVRKDTGGLSLYVLGLDVRKEATPKFFEERMDLPADPNLEESAAKIAQSVVERAQPVRWLRVKLDAYWPPGSYQFDNVAITQEPEPTEKK